ncbi:S-adenosyl methyltransferase [Lentzea flaviverrucosa]|uniref:S-adenosyl methyltransferase n=2 Tax=Lentzea flaviverrucosa TaxID=200379 RepID=A0A1H9WVA3_9PSEU|nr:S-adenosyl methyltransferase [Lentzea flaviverrucosa]SES37754.1 S-adenosyl methyltransferase [Lentzea flaviverrucosa]
MRTRQEISGLFDGLELIDPGVVYLPEWRPDHGDEIGDASGASTFAGVARKLR